MSLAPCSRGPHYCFFDANILLSRTLRDWFCLIDQESGHEGIQLRWSEDVLAEFVYHLRKKNPSASEEETGGLRRRIEKACPEALIANYLIREDLLQSGRDKFDAHVVAAAEHGGVDYLVTNNVKDFEPFADDYEFEIYTADEMLCLINERRPLTLPERSKFTSGDWPCWENIEGRRYQQRNQARSFKEL